MSDEHKDDIWKYAPLWAIAFGATATVLKGVGQRYILERDLELNWSDVATALAGAAIGYGTFRLKHGQKAYHDAWYKR